MTTGLPSCSNGCKAVALAATLPPVCIDCMRGARQHLPDVVAQGAFLEPWDWTPQSETSSPLAYLECLSVDIGRRHAEMAAFMFAPGSRARWREYVQTFDAHLAWGAGPHAQPVGQRRADP